jgi:DNA polymerase
MKRLWIDLETYSPTDINAGPYRYTEDPDFLILMAAWSIDEETVHCAVGEDEVFNIPHLWDKNYRKVAHNANFERVCLSHLLGYPVGEYMAPEEFRDTQAIAAEHGYPQKLERLAPALGAEAKDSAGTRLINLFSKPNRAGRRVLPEEKPKEWQEFINYCIQDVRTLIDVDRRLSHLGGWPTSMEQRIYLADQRINDHGMRVDEELAAVAATAAVDNQGDQEQELCRITGIANANSIQQLTKWLHDSGLHIPNLKAETVERVLRNPDLTEKQRRVLELRQELALVASKKFTTAIDAVSADGRLRGGFRFYGAHTGRWAGRGVQPHNLPRASLLPDGWKDMSEEELHKATETLTEAAILDLVLGLGAEAQTLKALVRALFLGPYTVVDYAQIEARVIAWLSEEQWVLKAFKDGRDIYTETAERMGGLTRAQGKVAVLALGYNGGIEALRRMGATGDDSSLQFLVDQWRKANPRTVRFWKQLERAFIYGGKAGPRISVVREHGTRNIVLPSGRALVYHGIRIKTVETEYGPRKRIAYTDPRKGFPIGTYGGRLAENVTQAVARDILAESLPRLHEHGYDVAGHIHDEIIVEGIHDVAHITKLMTVQPDWAPGLSIDGAGFNCARYRKG